MKALHRLSLFSLMTMPLVMSSLVFAHGNEERSTKVSIGGGEVIIDYVAPSLNGRDLMSMISPGSYWRMGADKPTTLSTDVDLMLGGRRVPKGTYTLLSHFIEEGNWSLVVAEGASGGEPQGVVVETPGTMGTLDTPVEQMTIHLKADGSKGKLVIEWGPHQFIADFTAP